MESSASEQDTRDFLSKLQADTGLAPNVDLLTAVMAQKHANPAQIPNITTNKGKKKQRNKKHADGAEPKAPAPHTPIKPSVGRSGFARGPAEGRKGFQFQRTKNGVPVSLPEHPPSTMADTPARSHSPSPSAKGKGKWGKRGKGRQNGLEGNSEFSAMPYHTQKDAPHTPKHNDTPSKGKRKKRALFEMLLQPSEYETLITAKQAFVGVLRVVGSEGYVQVPEFACDIHIPSRKARNRTFDGELVVVRLLPRETWRTRTARVQPMEVETGETIGDSTASPDAVPTTPTVTDTPTDIAEEAPGDAAAETPAKAPKCDYVPTEQDLKDLADHSLLLQAAGCVVGLKKTQRRSAVGQISRMGNRDADKFEDGDRVAHFYPNNRSFPLVFVPLTTALRSMAFKGVLCEVQVTDWPISSTFPFGKVEQWFGESGNLDVETNAICVEYGIGQSDFPPEVYKMVPTGLEIPEEEIPKRTDLRHLRIFSIDPPTARDLDDTLHIQKLPNGNLEIGVHIADVSHYIPEGSPIDLEARERSTSFYFPQKVIPMLPRELCDELCSLKPGRDRLAFSAVFEMDQSANLISERFHKSVIHSRAHLSYNHAQLMIEAGDLFRSQYPDHAPSTDPEFGSPALIDSVSVDEIASDVQLLYTISSQLRAQRFANGALAMNNSKLSFELNEEGLPTQQTMYQIKQSNQLVEEFMLLANMRVARFIAQKFPATAVLRNHPPPKDAQLEEFRQLLMRIGLEADTSSSGSLKHFLEEAELRMTSEEMAVIQNILTRSMQAAQYLTVGNVPESAWRHYALSVQYYTHFTSPIRRYPDILVHRFLANAISADSEAVYPRLDQSALSQICIHCNERKVAARNAQQQSLVLFLAKYLELRGTLRATGYVCFVDANAFKVFVPAAVTEWSFPVVDWFASSAQTFDETHLVLTLSGCSLVTRELEEGASPEVTVDTATRDVRIELLSRVAVEVYPRIGHCPFDVGVRLIGLPVSRETETRGQA